MKNESYATFGGGEVVSRKMSKFAIPSRKQKQGHAKFGGGGGGLRGANKVYYGRRANGE